MTTSRGPLKNFKFCQHNKMINFQYKVPYLNHLNNGGYATSCEIDDRDMYSGSFTKKHLNVLKRVGKFLTTGK